MLKFITNNWQYKLLALFFAVLFWIFVINEGFRVDFLEKEIPIQTYNLSDDLALVSDPGNTKVKIRAPKNYWQEYSDEDIEAYVDLQHFERGTYFAEVKVSTANPQIQVVEIDPENVEVVIESTYSDIKDITVETSGDLAEDFMADPPVREPDKADVSGARSLVEKVDKVVARVEYGGESSEIKKEVELEARDTEGNIVPNVIIDPDKTQVTIPVKKETELKMVSVNVKVTGSPAAGYALDSVAAEPSTVSIQGKNEILKDISLVDTNEVNIDGLSADKEQRAGLVMPEGVSLVEDQDVLVKLKISSSIAAKSIDSRISFKNLNDNFIVESYSPSVISLTVEGTAEALSAIESNPVLVNVNLIGRGRGAYDVEITSDMIQLPPGVTLKSIDTKNVKVVVEKK